MKKYYLQKQIEKKIIKNVEESTIEERKSPIEQEKKGTHFIPGGQNLTSVVGYTQSECKPKEG